VGAIVVALASPVLLGPTLAGAQGGDDRATAETLLRELEQDTDAARKAATADTVKAARNALERATRMRAAGDESHARIAEGLAREQAETARDLARAADAEKKATDARQAATDAGAQLEREQALLEEAIARAGRLRAELEAADREAKGSPMREAIESHDDDKTPPKKRKPAQTPSHAPQPPKKGEKAGGAP
jgi:hypothetical protein